MSSRPLLAGAALVLACATPGYSVADLDALERQRSWEEMVTTLAAVAPSKRDARWEAYLARAGAGYLSTIEAKSGEPVITESDALIKRYPVLATSPVFMAARAELGLAELARSYGDYRHSSGRDEWVDRVLAVVEKDTVTPGLARRAATEVVLGRLIPRTAFPLYRLALEREGEAVCADPKFTEVMLAVVEDGAWRDDAKAIITGRCWTALREPVLAAMAGSSTAVTRHGCELLAGVDEVKARLETLCVPVEK